MSRTENRPNKSFTKTFVGGIPINCLEKNLSEFMSTFGKVETVFIAKDGFGQNKGFAFVDFSQVKSTQLLFGEHSFMNKTIEVKFNLSNQIYLFKLPGVPNETDIRNSIQNYGFEVSDIIIGSDVNGIPTGGACVGLTKDIDISKLLDMRVINVAGSEVSVYPKITRKSSTSFQKEGQGRNKKTKKFHENSRINHQGIEGSYFGSSQIKPFHIPALPMNNLGMIPYSQEPQMVKVNSKLFLSGSINSSHQEIDIMSPGFIAELNNRKLSSSLRTDSKEYYPPSNKKSTLDTKEDSAEEPFSRTISHSTTDNKGMGSTFCDQSHSKLSGLSYSFHYASPYSMGYPHHGAPRQLKREITIDYYTFPGKE